MVITIFVKKTKKKKYKNEWFVKISKLISLSRFSSNHLMTHNLQILCWRHENVLSYFLFICYYSCALSHFGCDEVFRGRSESLRLLRLPLGLPILLFIQDKSSHFVYFSTHFYSLLYSSVIARPILRSTAAA